MYAQRTEHRQAHTHTRTHTWTEYIQPCLTSSSDRISKELNSAFISLRISTICRLNPMKNRQGRMESTSQHCIDRTRNWTLYIYWQVALHGESSDGLPITAATDKQPNGQESICPMGLSYQNGILLLSGTFPLPSPIYSLKPVADLGGGRGASAPPWPRVKKIW